MKKIADYIDEGYTIQRLSKLLYENGNFYKLPVLPTKDIGIPIDEIIEGPDNKFQAIQYTKNTNIS